MDIKRAGRRRYLNPISNGIWADDISNTLKDKADSIKEQILCDDDNYVLCLSAPWGCGKTFFIRRFIASLKSEGMSVVHFNAWENDCGDDPMIMLATLILEEVNTLSDDIKTSLVKALGGMAVFAGKSILKGAVTKLVGQHASQEISDKCSEAAEGGISAFLENRTEALGKEIVKASNKKVKFTEDFKDVLEKLSLKNLENGNKPIFIFVDELDRCRPTFALEILERIKHLFDVYGIKFVIACDLKQLGESVKSVYGNGFDAHTYLHRFFDSIRELKPCFDRNILSDDVQFIVESLSMSLRDQEKLHTELKARERYIYRNRGDVVLFIIFLMALRIKNRKLFDAALNATSHDIEDIGNSILNEFNLYSGNSASLGSIAEGFGICLEFDDATRAFKRVAAPVPQKEPFGLYLMQRLKEVL